MNAQMFGIVCSVLASVLGSLFCLGVAMGCCGMISMTQNDPEVPALRQIHHESCQCTALSA